MSCRVYRGLWVIEVRSEGFGSLEVVLRVFLLNAFFLLAVKVGGIHKLRA